MSAFALPKLAIVFSLILFASAVAQSQPAPDINLFKIGVVKIRDNITGQEGSGFIIGVDRGKNIVYILTASHVVGDDNHPQVTFFTRQDRMTVAAKVFKENLQMESNDRGLAVLWVNENIPSDVMALPLAPSANLNGGDKIYIVGIPIRRMAWSVIEGSVETREGRDIIFKGNVSQGVSGAPIIKDGAVVGMVTAGGERPIGIPSSLIDVFIKGAPGVVISKAQDVKAKNSVTIYRVRITVLNPQQNPVDSAELRSSLGGEFKKTAGGWELDIPSINKPADGKLTIYASELGTSRKGHISLILDEDPTPSSTIQLHDDASAFISVVVYVADADGGPVEGIVLSSKGEGPPTEPTDKRGQTNIRLPKGTQAYDPISLLLIEGPQGNLGWTLIGDGVVPVPPLDGKAGRYIQILVMRKSEKRLLANHKFITKFDKEYQDKTAIASPALDEEKRRLAAIEMEKQYGTEGAEQAFSILQEETNALGVKSRRIAEVLMLQGQSLYAQGDYHEAVNKLSKALTLRPGHSQTLSLLALALTKAGDYVEAEQAYKRFQVLGGSIWQEDADMYLVLGNYAALLRKLNRESEAIKAEERASELRAKSGKKAQ